MKSILDKCDVILDANDPDFAEQFREAVGLELGESLEIITPQFTRTDGIVPALPQINFIDLHKLPPATLRAIGCSAWDEPDANGKQLWLLPGEWYDHIPEGMPLVCIDGKTEPFERGKTDDDTRFGCLAYGITIDVGSRGTT